VRDTARSLHISPTTVLSELKKKEGVLESVNTVLLRTLNPEQVTVDTLVGFQGRGCAEGVQPDFCHALLLEALLFQ